MKFITVSGSFLYSKHFDRCATSSFHYVLSC